MSDTNIKLQQESFFIPNSTNQARKKIVRQDRWPVEPEQCFITNTDYTFEVLNLSTFGCACLIKKEQFFIANNLLNQSEPISFKLVYNQIETQEVNVRLVRFDQISESAHSAGFEVVGQSINVERCQAISDTASIVQKQKEQTVALQSLPTEFKALVYEVKDWFSNLQKSVAELEKKAPLDDAKANEEFKVTVAETLSDYVYEYLTPIHSQLPAALKAMPKELELACVAFMKSQLAPFIYGAPFANRAYYKPRGYAGDYEMMNHLYRDELVGKTLFDQCMHRYFIDEPAANAVKNRGEYLFGKIKQVLENSSDNQTVKIVSVASGPAMEIQLILQRCSHLHHKNVEFIMIDQDEYSLKHAQKMILSLQRLKSTNFKFKFINMAIKNIIVDGLPEKDCDLVYTAGLFDYFSDPVAQIAGKQLYDGLKKSKGHLIIGNFSKNNPTVALMDYLLDWILIYRSEQDMVNLFKPFSSSVSIEQESLGINLFAVIR